MEAGRKVEKQEGETRRSKHGWNADNEGHRKMEKPPKPNIEEAVRKTSKGDNNG